MRLNAVKALYRAKSKSKTTAYMSAWHQANKEYELDYRSRIKDQIAEGGRERSKGNRHKQKAYQHRRRAIALNSAGRASSTDFKRLPEICPVCLGCGAAERLEADHVVPLAKGGADSFDNLQTLCRSCGAKNAKIIDFRPA